MPVATPAKKPAAKKAAPKKTTAKKLTPIEAYKPHPQRPVQKYRDLPFCFDVSDDSSLHEALDDITLAAESGKLTKENWVREIFKTTEDFENFLEELSGYDELYRITDRWWHALAALGDTWDEEYFARCEDIADGLRRVAHETGQL